ASIILQAENGIRADLVTGFQTCALPILTFHRHMARLSCHLCGHTAAVPKKCPDCGKDALIYAGFGTEKVESTVSQFFPKAVVRRSEERRVGKEGKSRKYREACEKNRRDK